MGQTERIKQPSSFNLAGPSVWQYWANPSPIRWSSPLTTGIRYCGSLCDREVACSASDRQGSIFESCVLRAMSSHLTILNSGLNPIHFMSFPYQGFQDNVKFNIVPIVRELK